MTKAPGSSSGQVLDGFQREERRLMRRVVLVHTVAGLMPVFQELAEGLPGDVKVSNIVDESLLEDAIAAGRRNPAVGRPVVEPTLSAAGTGAAAGVAPLFFP